MSRRDDVAAAIVLGVSACCALGRACRACRVRGVTSRHDPYPTPTSSSVRPFWGILTTIKDPNNSILITVIYVSISFRYTYDHDECAKAHREG